MKNEIADVSITPEQVVRSYEYVQYACILNETMRSLLHCMELALKHGSVVPLSDEGFIDRNICYLSMLCEASEEWLGYLKNGFES